MFDQIDKQFDLIIKIFAENGRNTELINKAYGLAKELHKDQFRKDGTPYLSHPVDVALILAKLDFDENVISAALLHDVVEDCGYLVEQISKEFNDDVAKMVDCVSAIDKTKYIFDNNDIYEDENFEKASIEEQSFKKMVVIGKDNPAGICIKFADRLHNLRTIGAFEFSKQLEKVKETEKWIIPLAKILNTEYFYRAIKNECFKIKYKHTGEMFLQQCQNYFTSNKSNAEHFINKLGELLCGSSILDVKLKKVREYKIFEDLCKKVKNINISNVSQGQILKVSSYNLYLLYTNKNYEDVVQEVLNVVSTKSVNSIKIIDANVGSFTNKPYYQIEDRYKNKYNLYLMSYYDYIVQRNGTINGQIGDLIDDDNLDRLNDELIKVMTRSGETKYILSDSTVLDFAFKIHKDIGMGFKYAIVNGSKTKLPPYTKLYDGDKVEIVVEKAEDGKIIEMAQLKWLAYVNTDFAKKILIKHFEKKIY